MKLKVFGMIVMLASIIWSCEQPFDELSENLKGSLTVKITDAPFPASLVKEANITISKVQLKRAGDGISNDSSAFITVLEKEQTFNLLELRNGITEILAQADIPTGEYDELRLTISDAGVILTDTSYYNLIIPSGSASGLKFKIKPSLMIVNGTESEVLLDFDLSRSFKTIGNPKSKKDIKGFHFKPVVRVVNLTESGKISGTVTNEGNLKISEALISLFQGTDTITSALSDMNGYFAMIGIPVGTYNMECVAEGYDTLRVQNVSVNTGKVTQQDFVLSESE